MPAKRKPGAKKRAKTFFYFDEELKLHFKAWCILHKLTMTEVLEAEMRAKIKQKNYAL